MMFRGGRADEWKTTIEQFVDWAERAMMEEFDPIDHDMLLDIVSRIGLADVRAFGLTWEDCEAFPSHIGYRARIDFVQATQHTQDE